MAPDSMVRPSWDDYFMEIAELVSGRATCIRRKVGAVLVKDRRILCSGYNGAPAGIPHCGETKCLRNRLKVPPGIQHELCRGVHAEQNVIIQAAYHGVAVAGASLYCTIQPCSICAKMLVNAGIKEVFYRDVYDDPLSREMFDMAEVPLSKL